MLNRNFLFFKINYYNQVVNFVVGYKILSFNITVAIWIIFKINIFLAKFSLIAAILRAAISPSLACYGYLISVLEGKVIKLLSSLKGLLLVLVRGR